MAKTVFECLESIDTTLKNKANFDMAVELFKLHLLPLNDFLEYIKQHAPNVPLDAEKIKNRERDKLNNQLNWLSHQEKLLEFQRYLDDQVL